MIDPTERDARLALSAVRLIGAALALLLLLGAIGCAHCPPCEPEIQVQRVEVPVPVLPRLEPLPPLELPPWPDPPAEDAPAAAWLDWYAAMAATARERMTLLKARNHRLEEERQALEHADN